MAKTKVLLFSDKSWSSQTRWSKDKIKYNVITTARCPECGKDVIVGTAGLAGLSQHTGKSKCKKNVSRKKEETGKRRQNANAVWHWGEESECHTVTRASNAKGFILNEETSVHCCPSSSVHHEGVPVMMLYNEKCKSARGVCSAGSKKLVLREWCVLKKAAWLELFFIPLCMWTKCDMFFLELLPFLVRHIHFRKVGRVGGSPTNA